MVLKEDQAKVKALLTEAITVLCKNGLSYRNEFSVEGLLGVTLDNEEVFLISINETIREIGGQNMSPNPPSVQRRSPMPAPQRGQMGKGRGTPPANRARVNQGMQNARKRSLDGEFKNTHPQQGSTPGTPSHPSPHSSMGSPPGTPGTPQQLPGQTDPDQPPIKRLNDDGTQDGDDTLLEDGSANLAKIKSEPGSIPTGDGADWDSTQTDQHDPNNQAMQMPSFGDEFNLQGAMDPAMNVKMEQTGQIPQHSGGAGPGMAIEEGVFKRGRKIACNMCDKEFTKKSSLMRHMQLHTGKFSYYCEQCRKPFNNTTNFKEHMRVHEGLTYQCQYCLKTFTTKKAYSYHISRHTGYYRFRCQICDKGFNVKTAFEQHQASH